MTGQVQTRFLPAPRLPSSAHTYADRDEFSLSSSTFFVGDTLAEHHRIRKFKGLSLYAECAVTRRENRGAATRHGNSVYRVSQRVLRRWLSLIVETFEPIGAHFYAKRYHASCIRVFPLLPLAHSRRMHVEADLRHAYRIRVSLPGDL